MNYKPYTIWCPPWETTSGGIRVMYGLYGWLLAKGQEVHLNVLYDPHIRSVAIYPEIAHGNPLQGTSVVRYILNKPGVMSSNGISGPSRYDPQDKLYVFSELFNTVGADEEHHLFLPIINTHLFKDQGKKRTKKAVMVGKGINTRQHPQECEMIDRLLASNQENLANLLNECQVLYSYDPVSAMTEIARLCGCRVVMLNPQYTEEEYKLKYEPGTNGIGWGQDVELDTQAFRDHYLGMKETFSKKLDDFISATQ